MHIQNLSVRDFLGVTAVAIAPENLVTIVAGPNGAGKTSLYQAIRLALLDELPRIDFKKDAGSLVRSVASKGEISLHLGTGGNNPEPLIFTITLPDRKRAGSITMPWTAVPHRIAMGPAEFAAMDAASRMKLILDLAKVSMSKADIVTRLKSRGVPDAMVSELSPLLGLGFEKCALHAKEQAAQERGAWRAITGEAYGAVKALSWSPPPAPEPPAPPVDYEVAADKALEAARKVDGLRAQRATVESRAGQRESDRALAGRVEGLRTKVAELMVAAEASAPPVTATCPHCENLVEIAGNKLVEIPAGKNPASTHSQADIAEAKRRIESVRRELVNAEIARDRLAEPEQDTPNPSDDDIAQADEAKMMAHDVLRTLDTQRTAYQDAVRIVQQRTASKDKAKAAHERVAGWETAVTALEPGGIPSDLMAAAMAPFRAALKAVAPDSDTWPIPDMANDGSITAWGGRPYALLSESEQYRVDLVFAAALGRMTGFRFFMADRFDVLSPANRGEAIGWVLDQVDAGHLDAAWFFGTFKAKPAAIDGVDIHWIEGGVEV